MLTPDTFHQILQESEILSDLFFHQVLQESEIVLGWMGLGFQPGFENSLLFICFTYMAGQAVKRGNS
ncbi:Uncharacterised protein [Moraxella caviae]|nr:hypothetical protein [Moraxella caviae]VEW12882.1 Uncharacterised protein [Moraxella caviae]